MVHRFVQGSDSLGGRERSRPLRRIDHNPTRFARSPNAAIRRAVAEFLSQIKRREALTPNLSEVLAKLGEDNRARVRICVHKLE
jgi:hypothetical protein